MTHRTKMPLSRLRALGIGIQSFWLQVLTTPALAQFSPDQEAAFSAAVEGNFSSEQFRTLIAAVVLVLILLGFAWITYAAFERWSDGSLGTIDVALLLGRVSVLIIVAGLFLR